MTSRDAAGYPSRKYCRPATLSVAEPPRASSARAAAAMAASASGTPVEPARRPSSLTESEAPGTSPGPGGCGPKAAGGESAGSGITTTEPARRLAAATTSGRRYGSTRTSIVPPQARPTSHACSSLIP